MYVDKKHIGTNLSVYRKNSLKLDFSLQKSSQKNNSNCKTTSDDHQIHELIVLDEQTDNSKTPNAATEDLNTSEIDQIDDTYEWSRARAKHLGISEEELFKDTKSGYVFRSRKMTGGDKIKTTDDNSVPKFDINADASLLNESEISCVTAKSQIGGEKRKSDVDLEDLENALQQSLASEYEKNDSVRHKNSIDSELNSSDIEDDEVNLFHRPKPERTENQSGSVESIDEIEKRLKEKDIEFRESFSKSSVNRKRIKLQPSTFSPLVHSTADETSSKQEKYSESSTKISDIETALKKNISFVKDNRLQVKDTFPDYDDNNDAVDYLDDEMQNSDQDDLPDLNGATVIGSFNFFRCQTGVGVSILFIYFYF